MALFYTETVWRKLYRWQDDGRGNAKTYGREWANTRTDYYDQVAEHLVPECSTALVVGCGFGFLMERLVDRGVLTVGVDNSPWIHKMKNQEARDDLLILDATFGQDDLKSILLSEGLPTEFDVVITDNCMSSQTDDEARALADACNDYTSSGDPADVIHIVTCNHPHVGDTGLNSKLIYQWSLINPEQIWYDSVVSRNV